MDYSKSQIKGLYHVGNPPAPYLNVVVERTALISIKSLLKRAPNARLVPLNETGNGSLECRLFEIRTL